METVDIDNDGAQPVFYGFFGTRGFEDGTTIPNFLDALALQIAEAGEVAIFVVPDFFVHSTQIVDWCIRNSRPYQRIVTCSSQVGTTNDELLVSAMFTRIVDWAYGFSAPAVRDRWAEYLFACLDEKIVATVAPGEF